MDPLIIDAGPGTGHPAMAGAGGMGRSASTRSGDLDRPAHVDVGPSGPSCLEGGLEGRCLGQARTGTPGQGRSRPVDRDSAASTHTCVEASAEVGA